MACTLSHSGLLNYPEIASLVDQLKNHPAWRDSLSQEEIEAKLLKSSPYSFFLSPAEQEGLFYISFLDRNDVVHRHVFRIVPDNRGKMGFKNGAHYIYQDIDDLVPVSIGCSSALCCPCD